MVDLRNTFQSRQTIDLHAEAPGLTRLEVEEYDTISEQRQLEIERRFVERHRVNDFFLTIIPLFIVFWRLETFSAF